jgi:hypothetical protein
MITNDPKQIGNICGRFVAPALSLGVLVLSYLQNDLRTLNGLLTAGAWMVGTAVLCIYGLPYALNFINARAVARWRSALVKKSIAELCTSLFEDDNWMDALRQTTPPTVAGRIAQSEILKFLSSRPRSDRETRGW